MNISKSEMQAIYSCTPNIGKCFFKKFKLKKKAKS